MKASGAGCVICICCNTTGCHIFTECHSNRGGGRIVGGIVCGALGRYGGCSDVFSSDTCGSQFFIIAFFYRTRFFQNNYSAIKRAGQELGEKPDLYYWMSTPDLLHLFISRKNLNNFSTARLFNLI